jgi:uncharacterized protein YjiS (DUF1127 family)
MSANVLIALSGLRSEPIRRLAHWLIWRPARFIALVIVAGLEYRLRRRTHRVLSAMDDRMLADIGLHRGEIDAAIRGSGPERLPRYDAMI